MSAPSSETPLPAALLDSRARWRDLALLSADLLFETDAAGRFTFIAPDPALGRAAAALLGTEARQLLAEPVAIDPFTPGGARGLRAWLRPCWTGETMCLEFTAMPMAGGLRGTARDVTQEERGAEATGRALRRATALSRLLGVALRGRGDGPPEAALASLLAGLPLALGCAGAALLHAEGGLWRAGQAAGESPAAVLATLPPPGQPVPPGEAMLASVGPGLALLAWRARPFDADEAALLTALTTPFAALTAEAVRQRDLDAAAHTDALTGLLNRRGFTAALAERLSRGAAEGVLAYLDLDRLKPLNDIHGHAAGDAALRAMAARLRGAARPGDLAARLGGDEFAIWLSDLPLTIAAARCAPLGEAGPLPGWPEAGAEALRASLGLAVATPEDDAEALMARADAAMYRVKHGRRAA